MRVPKIQYRFIKEVEQTGVGGDARVSALAMADKIKQYPLEPQHVMASWERFTKKAIEDFKANRGNGEERDRQHTAYAILFSSMRDAPAAQSVGDLKQRIEVYSAKHPPRGAEERETPKARAAQQQPTPPQQSLLGRERPALDRQIDTALDLVRKMEPKVRTSIEEAAQERLFSHDFGHGSAMRTRPEQVAAQAMEAFDANRNERTTHEALVAAVAARAPSHGALLAEVRALPRDEWQKMQADARAQIEKCTPTREGLDALREQAIAARVADAIRGNAQTHREAQMLAYAREELECAADPRRPELQRAAEDLARGIA